jgi:hypothetical protein
MSFMSLIRRLSFLLSLGVLTACQAGAGAADGVTDAATSTDSATNVMPIKVSAGDNRRFNLRVVQSGHSLTDPIIDILQGMVAARGVRGSVIDKSTIPGSPMSWRWDNAPGYGAPDARKDIGNYDVLVLTEGVSLSLTLPHHNSDELALRWFKNAWSKGNGGKGAETILYASWVHINSGPNWENPYKDPEGHLTFRKRLPLEFARWKQVANHVNANRPKGSPEMRMIPGPLLMAALYDEIQAGRAPGLNNISDVFKDEIHVNDKGAYFISLAHFAVIYGQDPRGLPFRSGMEKPPSRELALWMQELVWKVVTNHKGSGVRAAG